MLKKEIYPKTRRMKCSGENVYVTEKLDGSNLMFFKKDQTLYIAQRKNIFSLKEVFDEDETKKKQIKGILYGGLYGWLEKYGKDLENSLNESSVICGEWLGMGQIKYPTEEFDKRFYMFAKANITDNFELSNIRYDHSLFNYPFVNQEFPDFIGIVPEVDVFPMFPSKEYLDVYYDKYKEKVGRKVEGFILNYNDCICKYVRMKNGKLSEHFDRQ